MGIGENNAALRGVICRYMGYRPNRFDAGKIFTLDCIYCSLDKRLPNGLRSDRTQSCHLFYTLDLMQRQALFKTK